LFRHSLATSMLRSGATLGEIGEVLRHRLPSSTEIYAKVDFEGLRSLAHPWPIGGAQ
jgi:site-specific recombinase XerD